MKLLVGIILVTVSCLSALSFDELETHLIPGVSFCSIHLGDYNNNGHLDILITGDTGLPEDRFVSYVYRNNGNQTFTLQENIRLQSVTQGDAVWGDFNNNGFLDIALCGAVTLDLRTVVTKIYLNNRQGGFTETDILLPGVKNGSLTWIDFDNNGWQDLFITGDSDAGTIARLYRNINGERLDAIEDFEFPGSLRGDVSFIDFNGNGYKDLVLTGVDFTGLYINDLGSAFIHQAHINLPNLRNSSVSWGDYDGDGLPDLLISGMMGTIRITRVYRNIDGTALEWQQNIALPGIRSGNAVWHDMNNNGRLDIIISGELTIDQYITKVYLNAGGNTFTEAQNLRLTGVRYSSIEAADLNNNGKTDLILAGMTTDPNNQRVTKIYLNQIDRVNTSPEPPNEFNVEILDNQVRMSWNTGSDDETNHNSLNYNLAFRKVGQDRFLIAPNSNLINGFRRISSVGNAGYNLSYIFNGIDIGSYEWAVQTIDSAGAGSSFSAWQRFDFMPKPQNVRAIRTANGIRITWDRVEEAEYYRVYGSGDPQAEVWTFLGQLTETSVELPFQYEKYFFKVTAVID